jgi:hypothetical protein
MFPLYLHTHHTLRHIQTQMHFTCIWGSFELLEITTIALCYIEIAYLKHITLYEICILY